MYMECSESNHGTLRKSVFDMFTVHSMFEHQAHVHISVLYACAVLTKKDCFLPGKAFGTRVVKLVCLLVVPCQYLL
jgi:hypothetical protein